MRVIIDANVAIAAVASRGLCEAILELCLETHRLILCEGILNEIDTKLRTKIKISSSMVTEYLRLLRGHAQILEPEHVDRSICRDPNDLMILGLVEPGEADAIITGDMNLLIIKKYKNARILSPRDFWESNKTPI
jgi:putative PIN family toxin of toxin-antitoxin system